MAAARKLGQSGPDRRSPGTSSDEETTLCNSRRGDSGGKNGRCQVIREVEARMPKRCLSSKD